MSERLNDPSEKLPTPEVPEERYEKLGEDLEKQAEKGSVENAEKKTERAKGEALEQAISVERGGAEKKKARDASAPKRRNISKKEREASFQHRMTHVRGELSAPERAFSKFIHAKPIEKTSEVLGSTVARPNAILSGAVVAFFAVLGVYLLAKNLGYPLSGFETIGAFIIGWVLGLLYDFFRIMITGKK